MNASPSLARMRRQRGAVSVAITLVVMLLMASALGGLMVMSTSSTVDSARQEEHVAAMFLAESGIERAQGALLASADSGTFASSACTGLAASSYTQGRGTFAYVSAAAGPASCTTGCSTCTVVAKGTVGSSVRLARALITTSTSTSQGKAGYGSSFTFTLSPTVNNTLVFTNVAFRVKDSASGGNATMSNCVSTSGSSLTSCTTAWNLAGTGANALGGSGAYSSVATAGNYTLSDAMTASNGSAATRYYVATGAFFTPLATGGTVAAQGYYGMSGGGSTINLPTDWFCGAPPNFKGSAAGAGGSDTLVYGFSSVTATSIINGVSTVGSASSALGPMRRVLTMNGAADPTLSNKYLNSQIWSLYNPSYYPGSAPNAASGVSYTATVGATGTAAVSGTGASRTLTTTASANLYATDTISFTDAINGTTTWTVQSGSGTVFAINRPGSFTNASGTFTVSATKTLNVTVLSPAGLIQVGDQPSGTGFPTGNSVTALPAGSGTGSYTLGTSVGTINSGAPTTMSVVNGARRITLSGSPSATPSIGTAVSLSDGTSDLFDRTNFTASIAGPTMTVSSGAVTLNAGDALFGANVSPGTVVVSGSGSTYTISPSQTAAAAAVVARTAVTQVVSSTAYTVSRAPTTAFSGRKICGGLCPFVYWLGTSSSGTSSNVSLSNLTSGDDWASGFLCLSGVNPNNIQVLNSIVNAVTRSQSTEPVY